MKLLIIIANSIKWLLLILITFLAIYFIWTNFNIFGNYYSFVVQSGSMEPAIMTGDIIIVHNKNNYYVNDVVTFVNNERIITHRITEIIDENIGILYETKGDANRTGDEDLIVQEQIIGKVVFVLPKLGYFVSISKSKYGLIFLLLIPAFIFIVDELIKLKKKK